MAERLLSLVRTPVEVLPRAEKVIDNIEKEQGVAYAPLQRQAVCQQRHIQPHTLVQRHDAPQGRGLAGAGAAGQQQYTAPVSYTHLGQGGGEVQRLCPGAAGA